MITQVPELYDGGYWYAVKATMTDDAVSIPLEIFAANYADIAGLKYAAVRLNEQMPMPIVDHSVSQIITACFDQGLIPQDNKFFARIEGR